jgi:hypothetical protein
VERGHVARRQPNQEFTVHASMYSKVCLRHDRWLHQAPARHNNKLVGQVSSSNWCKWGSYQILGIRNLVSITPIVSILATIPVVIL